MARSRWAAAVAAAVALGSASAARAQGGPPMITDDPGTPGNGKWEVNVAFVGELTRDSHSFDAPLVDANYGLARGCSSRSRARPRPSRRRTTSRGAGWRTWRRE